MKKRSEDMMFLDKVRKNKVASELVGKIENLLHAKDKE